MRLPLARSEPRLYPIVALEPAQLICLRRWRHLHWIPGIDARQSAIQSVRAPEEFGGPGRTNRAGGTLDSNIGTGDLSPFALLRVRIGLSPTIPGVPPVCGGGAELPFVWSRY